MWKLKTQQNRNSKASESFFFHDRASARFFIKKKKTPNLFLLDSVLIKFCYKRLTLIHSWPCMLMETGDTHYTDRLPSVIRNVYWVVKGRFAACLNTLEDWRASTCANFFWGKPVQICQGATFKLALVWVATGKQGLEGHRRAHFLPWP